MSDNIVSHLREWGLKVVTKDGYKERGRPYTFTPKGVICHHTASGSSSGNFGSETVVTYGRPDLPGPLCQFLLGRDGTVMVIANGYANHAGYGGPRAGIPENSGNTYTYGIEAENNGLGEKWSKEQLNAYYRLCAALLDYMDIDDVSVVFGHKEWAPGRKIDPAGIDMNAFRGEVKRALKAGPSLVTVRLSRLKPGKRNRDILRVKRRLARRGFFKGEIDKAWTDEFKAAYLKWEKRVGVENPDGMPGRKTLKELGFKVLP